jgi:hypothetical protein
MALPAAPSLDTQSGSVMVRASAAGVCHAICVWVEFDFTPSHVCAAEGDASILDTGPRLATDQAEGAAWCAETAWAQGICFLGTPVSLEAGEQVGVSLELNLLTAAMSRVDLHPANEKEPASAHASAPA